MTGTKIACMGLLALLSAATAASAQQDLFRGDEKLDVQALTCGQLANTYQQDADALTMWYSGWYNGLAKKHMINVKRGKDLEHQVIVYCKENRGKKVIQALDVIFKQEREDAASQ